MEAVLGLLVISAGVSHGLETSCDARQNVSQCYGALGGTVYLQLVTDDMGYDELSFYKDPTGAKTEILRSKKGIWVIRDNRIKDRVDFFINNGTFRLNNTRSTDSGEYLLEYFNSVGISSWTRGLQLFIEAPVSSPQLSSECLSHGEMKVSCSSEGDGPQYSWTLDGQTLRDTETSPGDETNTITLKKGLSGNLTCTIRNNISSDTVSRIISHCPGLIYVNCTLSNGTKVSEWVNATGNTLCVESTTVATVTESPISKTSTGMEEKSCDAREHMSCHGALGETVYLQLMNNATGSELVFKKDPTGANIRIFSMKNNRVRFHDPIKPRSEFFINNGTFRISNTEKTDSGEYVLEIYDSHGARLSTGGVQLIIGGSGFNVFVYFQLAEVFILMAICLGSYCFYKKKTCPQEQDDGQ
ncbi:uncharacterized protein LOC115205381 isoform X2 [Salmo trutta]|uniref:uncharacterized protein LOC115205381 isoform X2 n=1 Tax=Salmo trutta TaxID=8032 RepID=UPI00113108B2|nr:uncharacterized protein LOC115205381 isoform X2 [Salmo trutta]